MEHDNKNLLEELMSEIPFLLHYLINRPFSTECTTRMWFQPGQIATSALKKVKVYNRNKLEVEIAQQLLSLIDQKDEISEVCFCVSDVQSWLKMKGFKYDSNSIRRVLQEHWKLTPSANSNSYLQYRMSLDGSVYEYNFKGRFFRLSKDEILKLNFIPIFDDENIND